MAIRADVARLTFGVDGTGVQIGSLSDSFDCLGGAAGDVGTGDLPAGIAVLAEEIGCGSGSDEGRAMMQLITDVAPGATQSFHSAFNGMADFALGIEELAGCPPGSAVGCIPAGVPADVLTDDVVYFGEAMFQDDFVAQAVDVVKAAGVSYFSSAGNQVRDAYSSPFFPSGVPGFTGMLHDFDPGPGVDTCQSVTIPTGVTIFSFQYNQPFFSDSGGTGATTDLDIGLFLDTGCTAFLGIGGLAFNRTIEGGSGDAVEVFGIGWGGPPITLGLAITNWSGVPGPGPAPTEMKYVAFSPGNGFVVAEYATDSGTVYGHSNAAGAEAVSSAHYVDTPEFGTAPPLVGTFYSASPTPIYHDTAGAPIGGPGGVIRPKPEITAPDGTNTTFFGFDVEPDGFPNFFGMSAAAPHAAAVAALLLEVDGGLTPDAVYDALESSAIDMDDPFTVGFDVGFDFATGFGLIQADGAIGALGETCNVVPATIVGTDGDDFICGNDGDDEIWGDEGDDTIWGGSGSDEIYGSQGHDVIYGGGGSDDLDGGNGNDEIHGGAGNDLIGGYDGDDSLYGDGGDDFLEGGTGTDDLDAGWQVNEDTCVDDGVDSLDNCEVTV